MQFGSSLFNPTRITFNVARYLYVIQTSKRLNPNSTFATIKSMASVVGPVAAAKGDELPHLQTVLLEAQQFPCCYPDYNLTDVHRAHIATRLSQMTKIDALIIYPALHWTQTLDKGDLVLAVAALRVKGKQPAELAEEWAREVSSDVALVPREKLFVY